jgi:hypothetical protein
MCQPLCQDSKIKDLVEAYGPAAVSVDFCGANSSNAANVLVFVTRHIGPLEER